MTTCLCMGIAFQQLTATHGLDEHLDHLETTIEGQKPDRMAPQDQLEDYLGVFELSGRTSISTEVSVASDTESTQHCFKAGMQRSRSFSGTDETHLPKQPQCPLCNKLFAKQSTQKRHIYYCRTRQAQPIVPRRRSCLSCARAKSRCTWTTKDRVAPCVRCSERGFDCGGQPTAEAAHSPSSAMTPTTTTSPGEASPTPSTAFSHTSQRSSMVDPTKDLALDPMLDLAALGAPLPDAGGLLYWQADLPNFEYSFTDPFAAGPTDGSWDGSCDFRNVSDGDYTISSELVYTTAGDAQSLVGTAYPTFEFYGPGQDMMGDVGKGGSRSQGVTMPYGSRYLSPYHSSEH